MLEVVVLLAQLGAQFSDTALSQMLSKPSLADRFREVSALSTVKIADRQVKVYQALQGLAGTLAIYFRLCYCYQNYSLCSVRRWSPAPWEGGYSYKFELNERHQFICSLFVVNRFFGLSSGTQSSTSSYSWCGTYHQTGFITVCGGKPFKTRGTWSF